MNDDITWAVDQTADAVPSKGGLTEPQTTSAIVRAMGTWDGQGCSEIPLTRNPTYGMDVGVLAGSPYIFADVQHAGWGDIDFPGGVLGATFTFMFVDGNGNPTDIDRDRKIDVAFREIYYDSSWSWAIGGGVNDVDVESVAVHEMGHGLSQAHFGKLFGTYANGRLHFAPMALMNAGYMGIQRDLLGTDIGGHCGLWASWPNL